MSKEKLQSLIDRVIGKEGILRTPAYWVKRLFNQVLEYSEEYTNKAIEVVDENVDKKVDKKAEPYILPASGEYAITSETGKKLIDVVNNPSKYILQSWYNANSSECLVTFHPTKNQYMSTGALMLTTPSWNTKESYLNGKLVEVQMTSYAGTIVIGDEYVTISISNFNLSIPIVGYVTDELKDSTEYAVQGKVIKAYVDGKVGNINSVLDTINGEEV